MNERKDLRVFLNTYFSKMSIAEFASLIHMSDRTLRRYESGEELKDRLIWKIEHIMNVIEEDGYVYRKWETLQYFSLFSGGFWEGYYNLRSSTGYVKNKIRYELVVE